ncbi:efflux RND transporter periplasmic adaptor subunit [Bacillus salitolerans]|uniref:Efflux RND transporter periplasmic adaptor subunit n=1 Tax=Bacillus salitolerans TaxID=1437434 RepID=A0ABW4LKP3_9BACI
MRKKLFFLIILSFLLSSCSTKEITKQNSRNEVAPVTTASVQKKSINESIDISGVAIPHVQIPFFTIQPFEVKSVHVQVGEQVSKGDILVSLNDEAAKKQLQAAKEAVTKIQDAITAAKKALPTTEQLTQLNNLQNEVKHALEETRDLLQQLQNDNENVTLEQVIESSVQITLKQAEISTFTNQMQQSPSGTIMQLETQLSQAKQNVEQAKRLVEQTEITSPVDGVVSSINVTEQMTAAPSIPLVTVIQLDQINATFHVNSFDVVKLKQGEIVDVTFAGIDKIYKGELKSISPSIDPETNLFTVTIPIENTDQHIKGGMKATATVITNSVNDTLVIPIHSILFEEDRPYVYVAQEGVAIRKEITIGIRQSDVVQVSSGLKEGEFVIVEGKERLTNGDSIHVSNKES